ncbi:hypothetical protein Tco_1377599 [Tanacetum coccineum]
MVSWIISGLVSWTSPTLAQKILPVPADGGEIFSGGKKCQKSNIGDSDNTGDGGKIVGGAIGAYGVQNLRTFAISALTNSSDVESRGKLWVVIHGNVKKQTTVANSTTKADYVAAANCCGQVLWIRNQMLDYGFNFMNTMIYIDNESTICIVKNQKFHAKTKHTEIRHHFIRDSYEKRLIQVIKIHSDHNVADLLTKAFDVSSQEWMEGHVGDEVVYKELGDRMERAATTASSLEAEHDSGNINRAQSMATLNEPSP